MNDIEAIITAETIVHKLKSKQGLSFDELIKTKLWLLELDEYINQKLKAHITLSSSEDKAVSSEHRSNLPS